MNYTTLVSTDVLASHLHDENWVIIDCRFSLNDTERGRQAYLDTHIPGAVYAHLDEDLSGPVISGKTGRHPLPTVSAMGETLSRWGIDPGVQVVVYDDARGSIAARLWWMLRWLGHQHVAVLDGGWDVWCSEGRPVASGAESTAPRVFSPRPQPEMVVDAETVLAVRNDPVFRIIDSRTEDRYRGENEPIDPIGGHIPGAVCGSFAANLRPDGRFRSQEELRTRFQALLGDVSVNHTIFYCGSGVTAAHNLLALAHADLGDGLLYAGSWSDWITDPGRPIEQASS